MQYREDEYIRFLDGRSERCARIYRVHDASLELASWDARPHRIRKNQVLYKDVLLDFGKHAGSYLADCPRDYIEWAARQPRLRGNPYVPRIARSILHAHGLPVPMPYPTPLSLQQAQALAAIAADPTREKYERTEAHYKLLERCGADNRMVVFDEQSRTRLVFEVIDGTEGSGGFVVGPPESSEEKNWK